MDELRGGLNEPDHSDRPERQARAAGGGDYGAVRQRAEPRSRAEYAAEQQQQMVAGRVELVFRSGGDVLQRFEPRRAGLPEISARNAAAYLDAHHGERPWLAPARGCSPEVQRIFAAFDQGVGHAHIRHEGWVTEEMNERRLRCLEDPAQLDVTKRVAGIDGLASGDQLHRCGSTATRITGPHGFAVAVARGVEHPDVQAALQAEFKEKWAPRQVVLPIADTLGADGHRYCTGWQLQPVDGSMKTARANRDAWAQARARDAIPNGPEPKARPVETFDGGTMTFMFGPNRAHNGYEIVTMYVNPPEGK